MPRAHRSAQISHPPNACPDTEIGAAYRRRLTVRDGVRSQCESRPAGETNRQTVAQDRPERAIQQSGSARFPNGRFQLCDQIGCGDLQHFR
jgi:hypothetical protein